jgi:hypothetical protein
VNKKSAIVTVTVHDKLQQGYTYERVEPVGKNFDPRFRPDLTPQHMLELGVFGGKYMTDCTSEFPAAWFAHAKMSPAGYDASCNFFGVRASQSLKIWQQKGWIHPDDPRGWFQWYCRYYMGRRHADDDRQIRRWVNMKRHIVWLKGACRPGDIYCRPRQRQALLHWAYDSRTM